MQPFAVGMTLGLAVLAGLPGPAMGADPGSTPSTIREIRMVIHEGQSKGVPLPLVLKVGVPVKLTLTSVSQQPGDVVAPQLFASASARDPQGIRVARVRLMTADSATILLTPQQAGRYGMILSGFRYFPEPGPDVVPVDVSP